MLRPDAPLIRHLSERQNQGAARAWQALPYCLLPGEAFADYAVAHNAALAGAMPHLEGLPWPDAVFDSPVGLKPLVRYAMGMKGIDLGDITVDLAHIGAVPDRGRCWFRVTEGARYLSWAARMSPWLSGDADLLNFIRGEPDRWIALELWEQRTIRADGTINLPLYPDVTLIPRSDPWDRKRWAHLYPNPACRGDRAYGAGFCSGWHCRHPHIRHVCDSSTPIMGIGVIFALCTLAYLLGMDEYLVEVSPILSERQRRQHARHEARGDAKPWTREDLPHFILIDPHRARDFGHPAVPQGGSHASPVPHNRRGHWRELRAERFERDPSGKPRKLWVKPTWVGEMAWKSAGLAYKVVPPHVIAPTHGAVG